MHTELTKLRPIVQQLDKHYTNKLGSLVADIRAAKDLSLDLDMDFIKREMSDARDKMTKLARAEKRLLTSSGLQGIMSLVYSTCRDTTFAERFDTNPHILSVRNGAIELKTGQLRQRTREDYCTFTLNMCTIPRTHHYPTSKRS